MFKEAKYILQIIIVVNFIVESIIMEIKYIGVH